MDLMHGRRFRPTSSLQRHSSRFVCVAVFVVIATVAEQCILMYAHKGTSIELLVCFQLKLRVKNRCSKRSGSNAIKVCIAL